MRFYPRNVIGELRIWICNFIIGHIPSHRIRLAYYKYVMSFNIAEGSSILIGCKFNCKGNFSIGKNSTINQFCHIDNRGGITIEENVSISPYVAIVSADHNVYSNQCEGRDAPVVLKSYVFIGFRATILKNVILEYGSVVGACSIITKNTEPFGIYTGVPAKKIGERARDLSYSSKYNRLFH